MDKSNSSGTEVRDPPGAAYFFNSKEVDDGASAASEVSKRSSRSGVSFSSKASAAKLLKTGSAPTVRNGDENENENSLNQVNKQGDDQTPPDGDKKKKNFKTPGSKKGGIFSRLFGSPKSEKKRDRKGDKSSSARSGAVLEGEVASTDSSGPTYESSGNPGTPPLPPTTTASASDGNEGKNDDNHTGNEQQLEAHTRADVSTSSQMGNEGKDQSQQETGDSKGPLNDSKSATLVESPVNGVQKGLEQSILGNSTCSPDPKDDIFLPHGGSSSSCSEDRRPQDTSMSGGILDSRLDEPSGIDYNYTPMKTMNSPGMAIPTPHWNKEGNDTSRALLFPHRLQASPNGDSIYYDLEEVDKTRFPAPAGFPTDDGNNKSTDSFSWEQVQRYVHETEERMREQLQEEHQQTLLEVQNQAAQALQEHGIQWKADSEAEYRKMDALLKEEQYKTQQKEVTILHKTTALEEMKLQVDQAARERRTYMSKIAQLEAELQKAKGISQGAGLEKLNDMKDSQGTIQRLRNEMKRKPVDHKDGHARTLSSQHTGEELQRAHQDELRAMQAGKDEALQQVEALKEQVQMMLRETKSNNEEDVIVLKAEKELAERRIVELQEQLDAMIALRKAKELVMPDSGKEALPHYQQLVLAKVEIESLQRQLDGHDISTVDDLDRFKELLAKHQESQDEIATLKEQIKELSRFEDKSLYQSASFEDGFLNVTNNRDKLMDKIDYLQESCDNDAKSSELGSDHFIRNLKEELTALRLLREADRLDQEQRLQEVRKLYDSKMEEKAQSTDIEGRAEMELEILDLKERLETSRQASASALNSANASFAAERDELTADLSTLLRDGDPPEGETLGNLQMKFDQEKQQIAEAYESKILALQKEKEQLSRGHESELKALKTKLGLGEEEQEVMQAKILNLERRLQDDTNKVRREALELVEKETQLLRAQMKTERNRYEKEKNEILESSEKECDMLCSKMEELRNYYKAEIERAKRLTAESSKDEIAKLQEQLEELRSKHKMLSIETLEKHQKELEDLQRKSETEIFALRRKLREVSVASDSERKTLTEKLQDLEASNLVMQETHAVELEQAKVEGRSELDTEIKRLQDELTVLRSETEGNRDSEAKRNEERMEYERQMRQIREEHGKEIEEMIAQLDLVEAEHNARCSEQVKSIKEKEAVISALGSQLADAEKRLVDFDDKMDDLTLELDVVQEEAKRAKEDLEQRTAEVERLKQSHQKAMEAELALREEACEAAREEMIERAEIQHQQANDVYKKLKHEYDAALGRISFLEKNIQKAAKEADEAKNAQASREADLSDELAQVKACKY